MRKIKPEALLAWLRSVRWYFFRRGAFVRENGGELDYQTFATVLMKPTSERPVEPVAR